MTDNPKRPVRGYQINGTHLSQGVASALRAYPGILSVTRGIANGDEQLLVEVDNHVESISTPHLIDIIARAGGQVKSILRLDGDTNNHRTD